MKTLLFLISCLALVGCTTMSKEQCQSMDWHEAGRIDGEKGEHREYYRQHQNSCKNSGGSVATDLYFAGWEEGHKKYCTAENGYKAGVEGRASANICSAEEYPQYTEQFKIGYGVYSLVHERNQIEEQIDRSHDDQSALMNISRAVAIWNGKSPTESLDRRKAELNEKIMTIDSNAPGGPQVRHSPTQTLNAYYQENPLDVVNTLGAAVGGLFGFGLGHAIQGRYIESGWKWTLADIGTIGALSVTSDNACRETQPVLTTIDGVSRVERQCMGNSTPVVGAVIAFLGVRMWEAYDLITHSSDNGNPYKKAARGVVIKPDGFAWVYNF